MEIQLTEQQVTNVKKVIFGNQKQANVTNEAVVKIIARGISEKHSADVLDSEESFVDACKNYLQSCIDNPTYGDDTLIMLLAGEVSLANIKADGPRVVHVNQPNPESPKFTFRVGMLGEDVGIDMDANSGDNVVSEVKQSRKVNIDCPYDKDDDYLTRARKIKDAILPLCPASVKTEIPNDEYAQALCFAEYYYKNIYNNTER